MGLYTSRITAVFPIPEKPDTNNNSDCPDAWFILGYLYSRIEKWENGKEIVLTANENYWMKGFPKFSKLRFTFK